MKQGVFVEDDYHDFFSGSLNHYTVRFEKYKNEFPGVLSILKAKEESMKNERLVFTLD